MGILSKLGKKAIKREEPAAITEDVKTHVLGEYPPPPSEYASEKPPPGMERFATPMDVPELPAPDTPESLRREVPEREHREPLRHSGKGIDQEILDRLALMDAQLGAIRAQVETINERIKIIDVQIRPEARR